MCGVWVWCSINVYVLLAHRQLQSLITFAQRKRGIHTSIIDTPNITRFINLLHISSLKKNADSPPGLSAQTRAGGGNKHCGQRPPN